MKHLLRAKLIKNNQLNVVHDDDLVGLLKTLAVYNSVIKGNHKCLFCGRTITLDNIDSIVPSEGTVQFTCDNEKCHAKLLEWR